MEPPILQCRNGHTVCSNCVSKLASPTCPKCRVSIDPKQPIRNLFMESLVQISGLRYPCENQAAGCTEVFSPGPLKKQHQRECKFRQIGCPLHKAGFSIPGKHCSKIMRIDGVLEHVIAEHQAVQKTFSNQVELSLQVAPRGAITNWNPIVLNSTAIFFLPCWRTTI